MTTMRRIDARKAPAPREAAEDADVEEEEDTNGDDESEVADLKPRKQRPRGARKAAALRGLSGIVSLTFPFQLRYRTHSEWTIEHHRFEGQNGECWNHRRRPRRHP